MGGGSRPPDPTLNAGDEQTVDFTSHVLSSSQSDLAVGGHEINGVVGDVDLCMEEVSHETGCDAASPHHQSL